MHFRVVKLFITLFFFFSENLKKLLKQLNLFSEKIAYFIICSKWTIKVAIWEHYSNVGKCTVKLKKHSAVSAYQLILITQRSFLGSSHPVVAFFSLHQNLSSMLKRDQKKLLIFSPLATKVQGLHDFSKQDHKTARTTFSSSILRLLATNHIYSFWYLSRLAMTLE